MKKPELDWNNYTKKPVTVQSIFITQENIHDLASELGVPTDGHVLRLHTLEGLVDARVGEWLIRGIKGEYYPCRADIFDATYDSP